MSYFMAYQAEVTTLFHIELAITRKLLILVVIHTAVPSTLFVRESKEIQWHLEGKSIETFVGSNALASIISSLIVPADTIAHPNFRISPETMLTILKIF